MTLDETTSHQNEVLSSHLTRPAFQWRSQVNDVLLAVRNVLEDADVPAESRVARAGALLRLHPSSLERADQPGTSGGLLRWQMRRISSYVDGNLAETIRIADLATLINLSNSHFCRKFRASQQESAHNFILRKRIERARTLMVTTRLSLRHIATDCGLCDQAHFCKIFRKIVGQTPSKWRRAQQLPESEGRD